MTLADLAGWVAPAATMIAAMMTAANLGTRVTGWGFVVFTAGSLAWVAVAVGTGQNNLLLTNAFLTAVNAAGIWRWLWRQARYEAGGDAAHRHSAAAQVPTLFPAGPLIGASLTGHDGETIGSVVEAMLRCDGASLAYLVVSEGGVGGVGERLHALAPDRLWFGPDGVRCDLEHEDLAMLPVLEEKAWPATAGHVTT